MTMESVVRISAIEHFVYCPRQCALIHCDGVWSDNAHTVRGRRAHRRVDSGRHRVERGRKVLRSIPLWSEALGLTGRADAVEIQGEIILPVEYKASSRHIKAADAQLCAQALCLEEMLDVEIKYGYLWLSGSKRRIKINFTSSLREEVHDIILQIRTLLITAKLPEAPNDLRCQQCQLLHYCLPELVAAPKRVLRYLDQVVFRCDI